VIRKGARKENEASPSKLPDTSDKNDQDGKDGKDRKNKMKKPMLSRAQ